MKERIFAQLQHNCPRDALRSWFDPLRLEYDADRARLTVLFPHVYFAPWFERHGKELFERCACETVGAHVDIKYAYPDTPATRPFFLQQQDGLKHSDTHTFDSFIANRKNAFPLAAAREVCNPQAQHKYNPFVLCGASGTGKTHLLRVLTHTLTQLHGGSVFSGSADDVPALLASGDTHTLPLLHKAILVDDVQRLAHNFTAQEKLVRLTDACLDHRCQMVFACAGKPSTVDGLHESFRSRLEVGLVVELKEPDIDVRMRFAHERARRLGLKLERAHLLLLAQRCAKLRHLSGVILKAAAFWALSRRDISATDLDNILRTSGDDRPLSCHDVVALVADHLHVDAADIIGSKRQPALVFARQTAMFLCREILGMSFPALGKFFGGKDHSTVQHAVKKISNLIVKNNETHILVTELKKKCLAR